MRIAPDQAAGDPFGVRIEQQLVGVETVAALGIVGAVHAIAVELARDDVGQIAMPDVIGALGERDAFQLAPAWPVEQAQLDLFGMR